MINMEQKRIDYKDVIDLGFKVVDSECDVYEEIYGTKSLIVDKKLTKKIYLEWDQKTGFVEMYRIQNKVDCNVVGRYPITDLEHLKQVLNFFGKLPDEELSYEERIKWFVSNYYETGMEYENMLYAMKYTDLDNVEWYKEIIKIPKYRSEL